MSKKEVKKWHWIVVAIIVLIAGFYKIYSVYYWPSANIKIGGEKLHILIANNPKHHFKGLSGRENMGKYDGMLFLFPKTDQHTIVMRDMNFPLDIVWLSKGIVVDIAFDIQPEPGFTEDQLTPYFSTYSSDAILELPAGFKKKTGLKRGDRMEIID